MRDHCRLLHGFLFCSWEVNNLDPNQIEIQAIKEILENKPELQFNPLGNISEQTIIKALELLEEYSEEISIKP
jgi:hypothetical protein